MLQLKRLRNLAESHLNTALKRARAASLTAAADPSEFIDEQMFGEFLMWADDAWRGGIGTVTALFGELPTQLLPSVIADGLKTASEYYNDLLKAMISSKLYMPGREPIYGEFLKGNLVQYGDVRPVLATLGGGSPEAGIELVGGVTSGQTMREWLRSNGIDTNKKIWLYGYEDQPRRVFNGHLQMDGLVFEDWNDDGLRIAPQDAWLRRSHYQPGDHFGCACMVAPYIPNFGDEYQISTQ